MLQQKSQGTKIRTYQQGDTGGDAGEECKRGNMGEGRQTWRMMEQTDKDMREITYEGIRNRWSEGGKGQVREGMEKYCPSRVPAFRCPQKKQKNKNRVQNEARMGGGEAGGGPKSDRRGDHQEVRVRCSGQEACVNAETLWRQ